MAAKKEIYIEAEERISSFLKSDNITNKKYYLYMHTRDDNDDVFYVGSGTLDKGKYYYRSRCCKKRNKFWKRVVLKTTFSVFVLYESDSKQEILDKEISFVSLMGRRNLKTGSLVNLTGGGEGMRDYKRSEEMNKKVGKIVAEANKHRKIKDITRERLRQAIKLRGIISPCRKVIAKDNNTGEIVYKFDSLEEAGKFFKRTGSAIGIRIKNRTVVNNLIFDYYDN